MNPTSVITIDEQALRSNLNYLRDWFRPGVRISSVVKGNAYGHGLEIFVPLAESCGIDHFSVYSSEEALEVYRHKTLPSTEIMIMGYLGVRDIAWAIENDVSYYVFDFDRINQTIKEARKLGKKARIHVEVETGMNRTGFADHEFSRLIGLLNEHRDRVEFAGLCTHFAGAESIANHLRIQHQKAEFIRIGKEFRNAGLVPELEHTCCSAAAIRLPEMQLDMVRIGILQYGFWPSREIFIEFLKGRKVKEDPLKRLISWKTSVMSVKNIGMGEFVGYGTTYLAPRDMTIAIVPIGYSHGFSRSLSNQGRVLLRGVRLPVIGMVNMNCLAIDVTEVPEVKPGEEVTLIGRDGEMEISVSSFGELSDQLNYELLTRLPMKIPRMIV